MEGHGQMTSYLLVLTLLSAGDVRGQKDCVSKGSPDNQTILCPGVYIVPAQPPLPPFFVACNASRWVANATAGGYTLVRIQLKDKVNNLLALYQFMAQSKPYMGNDYASVSDEQFLRFENDQLWTKLKQPNMTHLGNEYYCELDAIYGTGPGAVAIGKYTSSLRLALLADPSPVTLSVNSQTAYVEGDTVIAQCRGVIGLEESNVPQANLRLQHRQGDQTWKNVETDPHVSQTISLQHTDVGTRAQATESQQVRVCDLLFGCRSCVLSLRCIVVHELHVFEQQASDVTNLQATCTYRETTITVSTTHAVLPTTPVTAQTTKATDVKGEEEAKGISRGLLYGLIASGLVILAAFLFMLYNWWQARRRHGHHHSRSHRISTSFRNSFRGRSRMESPSRRVSDVPQRPAEPVVIVVQEPSSFTSSYYSSTPGESFVY
jgi:hypothetical protein